MNISQLMKSFLGEFQSSEAKVLELKVGQVVKGLVLQLLSEQEALLNIGGIQVRARLETPLKQGQVTMLQVQPESTSGQMIMKPLNVSVVPIADTSLGEMLRNFGIKDHSSHRQMLQQMHQEGIPLTKENVHQFARVPASLPEPIHGGEWLQAGVVAFKRGLPLTEHTLHAIHQILYGKPMHESLSRLIEQTDSVLRHGSAVPKEMQQPLKQLLGTARQIMASASFLLDGSGSSVNPTYQTAEGESTLPVDHKGVLPDERVSSGAFKNEGRLINANSGFSGNNEADLQSSLTNRDHSSGSAKMQDTEQRVSSISLTLTGLNEEASELHNGKSDRSSAIPNSAEKDGALPEVSQYGRSVPIQEGNTGQKHEASWLSSMLKTFGLDYERELADLLQKSEMRFGRLGEQYVPVGPNEQNLDNHPFLPSRESLSGTEGLKGLLLQLSGSEDLPPLLKDTMNQILQQITGQQLFLVPDRASMLSHITLFVPIKHENGNQTASIHIQSRKGKRGELDANNCRLWFDLQMKALGETIVDVQVVNKIVSVQVHNDHPFIARLLEANKIEMASAMERAGYTIFSLKCMPFPQKTSQEKTKEFGGEPLSSAADKYKSKPYKGVDIRV